jgi:hypothetical protein
MSTRSSDSDSHDNSSGNDEKDSGPGDIAKVKKKIALYSQFFCISYIAFPGWILTVWTSPTFLITVNGSFLERNRNVTKTYCQNPTVTRHQLVLGIVVLVLI